jgi:hypothetical protein
MNTGNKFCNPLVCSGLLCMLPVNTDNGKKNVFRHFDHSKEEGNSTEHVIVTEVFIFVLSWHW